MAKYTLAYEDKNINCGSVDHYENEEDLMDRFRDRLRAAGFHPDVKVSITVETVREKRHKRPLER